MYVARSLRELPAIKELCNGKKCVKDENIKITYTWKLIFINEYILKEYNMKIMNKKTKLLVFSGREMITAKIGTNRVSVRI